MKKYVIAFIVSLFISTIANSQVFVGVGGYGGGVAVSVGGYGGYGGYYGGYNPYYQYPVYYPQPVYYQPMYYPQPVYYAPVQPVVYAQPCQTVVPPRERRQEHSGGSNDNQKCGCGHQ